MIVIMGDDDDHVSPLFTKSNLQYFILKKYIWHSCQNRELHVVVIIVTKETLLLLLFFCYYYISLQFSVHYDEKMLIELNEEAIEYCMRVSFIVS